MKRHLVSLALVAAFLGTLALGAGGASAEHTTNRPGARALVDGILRMVAPGSFIRLTDSAVQVGYVEIDRSLSNLRKLNHVLDTSPVLRDNGVVVVDTVAIGDINECALTDAQTGILRGVLTDAQLDSLVGGFLGFYDHHGCPVGTDVVLAVLSSGDLVLITR